MAALRRTAAILPGHAGSRAWWRAYETDCRTLLSPDRGASAITAFPESHAASFRASVYVSAWLKCHYPDVFCAAILNSQPMGFYAPAQLVRDAIEHGVEARPVDVNMSHWDNTLEPVARRQGPLKTAVRLGFRQIRGMKESEAARITTARLKPYMSLVELQHRSGIQRATVERLAEADAFRSLSMDRRQALWQAQSLKNDSLPLFEFADERFGHNSGPIEAFDEPWLQLPSMPLGEQVIEDYSWLRLSLKAHPLALLRDRLDRRIVTARDLWSIPPGRNVAMTGLVIIRQRPGSAKGVVFATLEDETGFANCIFWPDMFENNRPVVMRARLMLVQGQLQREGRVIHVIARRVSDWTARLQELREDIATADIEGPDGYSRNIRREAHRINASIPKGRNFH
ncbi:MAG: hypothetical protein R3C97_06870 [Geminicoccaceae bacterium]